MSYQSVLVKQTRVSSSWDINVRATGYLLVFLFVLRWVPANLRPCGRSFCYCFGGKDGEAECREVKKGNPRASRTSKYKEIRYLARYEGGDLYFGGCSSCIFFLPFLFP